MASIWEYETSVLRPDRDVVGDDVEAADGRIGKIDEASNEAASSDLVVDPGFWIFGKKRLIPAGVIRRVDDEDRTRQRPSCLGTGRSAEHTATLVDGTAGQPRRLNPRAPCGSAAPEVTFARAL